MLSRGDGPLDAVDIDMMRVERRVIKNLRALTKTRHPYRNPVG
jgi:hypothetical protein